MESRRTRTAIAAAMALALCIGIPVSARKVTVSYYFRATNNDLGLLTEMAKDFEHQHPNIDVRIINNPDYFSYVSKLLTMISGGVAPDVVFLESGWYAPLADKGLLKDLTPLIKSDREFKLEDYWTVALKPWQRKGRLYAVPNDVARYAMFYNRTILDRNGIPVPSDDWTWDDMVEYGKKATKDTTGDGKPDTYGLCSYPMDLSIFQAGGKYFDDPYNPTKLLLDSTEAIAGLEYNRDLWKKYGINNRSWGAYEAGKCAFFPFGRWTVGDYFKKLKFPWDIVPLPRGKQPGNVGDGSGYQIVSSTKVPKEAWEFVKFMGGYKGQLHNSRQNWMTAANRKVALLDEILHMDKPQRKNYAAFTADMDYSFVKIVHPSSTKIMDALNESLNLFDSGKVGAKEAIDRSRSLVQNYLKMK